jgi:hypothetical protein
MTDFAVTGEGLESCMQSTVAALCTLRGCSGETMGGERYVYGDLVGLGEKKKAVLALRTDGPIREARARHCEVTR